MQITSQLLDRLRDFSALSLAAEVRGTAPLIFDRRVGNSDVIDVILEGSKLDEILAAAKRGKPSEVTVTMDADIEESSHTDPDQPSTEEIQLVLSVQFFMNFLTALEKCQDRAAVVGFLARLTEFKPAPRITPEFRVVTSPPIKEEVDYDIPYSDRSNSGKESAINEACRTVYYASKKPEFLKDSTNQKAFLRALCQVLAHTGGSQSDSNGIGTIHFINFHVKAGKPVPYEAKITREALDSLILQGLKLADSLPKSAHYGTQYGETSRLNLLERLLSLAPDSVDSQAERVKIKTAIVQAQKHAPVVAPPVRSAGVVMGARRKDPHHPQSSPDLERAP